MHFVVFDSDGITPLTGQAGSCTYYLSRAGAAAPEVVTIVEIGTSGHYAASFTPLVVGSYHLTVTCPDGRVVGDSFEVEAADIDDLVTDLGVVDGIVDAVNTRLPTDPADQSAVEAAISASEVNVIAEVDANEVKIDAMQVDITYFKDIEGGRWAIDAVAKQMVFYKSDNITEIMRFDLKGADGNPVDSSKILVHDRIRV